MQTWNRVEALWGSYGLITSELAIAKRGLREGRAEQQDVEWLRLERLLIASELYELGERPDVVEPGG